MLPDFSPLQNKLPVKSYVKAGIPQPLIRCNSVNILTFEYPVPDTVVTLSI